MTEVQKVSIGGYAFTLEVEAYEIVKQYLDELNAYYSQREGGAEVMEGLEERMAELLYEKCADDGVASVAEVRDIIAILGNPSAIESDDDPQPKKTAEDPASSRPKEKKRLFRDPTNKMLGGVCSGLAAYFKCDVVLIRIIFIGLCVLTGVVSCRPGVGNHFFSVNLPVPIIYIILWIAMPEARTVQQRWQMGVTNPPAGNVTPVSGEPFGSGLGRVLRIIIGCMLLLIAVSGLTFGVAALFGHTLFGWNLTDTGIFGDSWRDAVTEHAPLMLPVLTSVFYRITLLLTCFLPFVGMLYGGIMMIFDLRTPSWRPGLVIFLVWIIALTAFTVLTIMGLFNAGVWD
ncbi:MAG: PspC domain-containing protein [Oscillospiraceae bacterium]|nr:PspC domain-containing protein [Oscillospiraceae bacterium]